MQLIKTKSAQQIGEYKKTLLDEKRQNCDFVIHDIWGNNLTIKFNHGIKISGRGIREGNGVYYITRKVFDKLKTQYPNFTTSF